MSPRESTCRVSIVIPVYNEEESIEPLLDALKEPCAGIKGGCEIIFVDDGSTDDSASLMEAAANTDPRIKAIILRRNFGKTAALAAGFDHAAGEVIVSMDADLQNDPTDIPKLLEKLDEGYDAVSGWRVHRKDPPLSRILPSRIANWLISAVTGLKLHDYGCALKAYRREVLQGVGLYPLTRRRVCRPESAAAATAGASPSTGPSWLISGAGRRGL